MTKNTTLRQLNHRLAAIALFVVFLSTNFVQTAQAAGTALNAVTTTDSTPTTQTTDFSGFVIPARSAKLFPVLARNYKVDMTAYTSSVEECDGDPFTTADGSTTHDGIVATNFLPFGTKVRMPALFGDKIFEVHDRMNARYMYRIDVWMEKKSDMRQFGIHHNVEIEIVEMGDGQTQWNKKKTVIADNK